MATNQETAEVPAEGNVSVSDATALLAGFEENVDGGEGVDLEEEQINGGAETEGGPEEVLADDDGDHDELAADDDGDADDAEDYDDGDEGEDPWVAVKINGEDQEVRLSELRNGYQRQADYTRKTQELSFQRKQVEQGVNQVQQTALSYADAYLGMAGQIETLAPSENDIKDAMAFDPKRGAELRGKREQILNLAQNSKGLAVALHQQRQETLRHQMAQAAQVFPEVIPEWADMDLRKKELTAVAQHLVERGMDPKEIEQTANPVAWAIARDAWKYRQLQERTAAKEGKAPAPKVRKTRAPKPRLKGKGRKTAQARRSFNKTNSRDDAISLLAQFEE